MRRFLAIAVSAAIGLGGWLATNDGARAARTAESQTVSVRLGDRIRVVDAPRIGCRVVRMTEFGGRVVIDCRRAGRLAGTYGTFFTAHEAALVRFESSHTAKEVVVAAHDGAVPRCEPRR
jgi:hypothetical protein